MTSVIVNAMHLAGSTPSGFGVYTRNIVQHTPWPEGTRFLGPAEAAEHAALHGRLIRVPAVERPTLRLLWQLCFLNRHLGRYRPQLYFSPTPETIPGVRVPYVVVVHDMIPLVQPEFQSLKLRLFYRYVLPHVCRRAAAIITVSECTRRDLCRAYSVPEAKVHVVPNGYDTAHFHPRPADEVRSWTARHGLERYVLYVGRLVEAKNLVRMVEAFLQVAHHVPHDLVLAGSDEGGMRRTLEELAEAAGLADRLRFLDFVPYSELPLVYQGADAFLFPSLYEGFGLPPLEAMACGTPVVVSDRGALPEVVGDAGLYADALDTDGLAAQLGYLLTAEGVHAEYARRGLERAAAFSWERSGQMTREVLNRVL